MSAYHHNSAEAERVAEGFHKFVAGTSLAAAVAMAGCSLAALIGAGWHWWGAEQHRKARIALAREQEYVVTEIGEA